MVYFFALFGNKNIYTSVIIADTGARNAFPTRETRFSEPVQTPIHAAPGSDALLHFYLCELILIVYTKNSLISYVCWHLLLLIVLLESMKIN